MTWPESTSRVSEFLSIQAQDFIEDRCCRAESCSPDKFLSIQAQDFIEDTQAETIAVAIVDS